MDFFRINCVIDSVRKSPGEQTLEAKVLPVNAGIQPRGFDVRGEGLKKVGTDAGSLALIEPVAVKEIGLGQI